jgi:hypothetical protein
MNDRGEAAHPDARADGEGQLADHLPRVPGHDGGAHDLVRALAQVHLDEALLLVVDDGAIHLGQRAHQGVDGEAALLRLPSGETDVRDLWIRVGAPRDGEGGEPLASEEERVLDHRARGEVGGMGEFRRHAHVARRVDTGIGGLEMIVDLDAVAIVIGHANGLEAEPLHVGHPPRAHEDLVHGHVHRPARSLRVQHLASGPTLHAGDPRSQDEADALVDEGALDDLGRVGVLTVQDVATRVEERHVGAEAPEGLGQLAADGPPADDGEAPRSVDQLEHALVGEEAALRQAGDVGMMCACPRGDDRLLEAERCSVDHHGVTIHEPALTEKYVHAEATEAEGGVMVAEARAHRAHALHDRPEVDLRRPRHAHSEGGSAP